MSEYRDNLDDRFELSRREAKRAEVIAQNPPQIASPPIQLTREADISTDVKPFPQFKVPRSTAPYIEMVTPPYSYSYPRPTLEEGMRQQVVFDPKLKFSDYNFSIRKYIEDKDWVDSVLLISERGTPYRLMLLLGRMSDMERKLESMNTGLGFHGRGVEVSGTSSIPMEPQHEKKMLEESKEVIGTEEFTKLVEEMKVTREETKKIMEENKAMREQNERVICENNRLVDEMKKMIESEKQKNSKDVGKSEMREEIERLKSEMKKRGVPTELSGLLDVERKRVDELKEQLAKVVSDAKVLSDRSEENERELREEVKKMRREIDVKSNCLEDSRIAFESEIKGRDTKLLQDLEAVKSAVESSKSEMKAFIDSEMKKVRTDVDSTRSTMREESKSISESGMNVIREEMKTLRTAEEGEMKAVRGENAKVLEELGKFKEEEKKQADLAGEKERKANADMKSRLDGIESSISKLSGVKASPLSLPTSVDEKKEQPRSSTSSSAQSTPLNTLRSPIAINFPQVQALPPHPQYCLSPQLPQTHHSLPPQLQYQYQAPIQHPQYFSGVSVAVSSPPPQQYGAPLPLPASPSLPVQQASSLPSAVPLYDERYFPSGLQYTEKYKGEYKKMSLEDTEKAFAYFLLGEGHSNLLGINMILPFTEDAMESEYKADHPRAMALARAAYSTKMYDKKATEKNALQYSHTGPRRVTTHRGIFGILDSFCSLVGLRVNKKGSLFVIVKNQA